MENLKGERRTYLTPKQMEMLRELDSNETIGEIAARRGWTVKTTRLHCAAIYEALDVDGRRQAVNAARGLGLLENKEGIRT